MPDFLALHGPFPTEKSPSKTEETKAELKAFFAGPISQPATTNKPVSFGHSLYLYRLLAGSRTGSNSTPFDAVAVVHPAYVKPKASKLCSASSWGILMQVVILD